ncbi:MAG: hypothetical protein HKN31_08965, partial [Pricia sp.]|nr:hypothetical protein [Pricia sp.]
MRLPFIYVITFFTTYMVWSQTPEKMSYQAIVRESDNTLVSDAQVSLRIIVRQGSATGTNTYEETHSSNTNANGLVSLEIGAGNRISGDFSTIPWSDGPFFIETQVDPRGGSNYGIIGVSQLLSVPYALHAKYAENIVGAAGSHSKGADIVSFTSSRNIGVNDINNTIACTKTATLTLSSGFSTMKIGETINLEAHNGANLTVQATNGVSLNYNAGGSAM